LLKGAIGGLCRDRCQCLGARPHPCINDDAGGAQRLAEDTRLRLRWQPRRDLCQRSCARLCIIDGAG